jgi:multidrug resistance efflux pump
MLRRSPVPPLDIPALPAKAPAEAEVTEARVVQPPAPLEPAPPLDIPARPAEAPAEAEVTETRAVQPPAPPEPAPPIEIPPLPTRVDAPRHEPEDLPVQAAPEQPPTIPVHDLPSLPADIVPPEVSVVPTLQPPPVAPLPEPATDEPALPVRPAAYWAEPSRTTSTDTSPEQPESLAWTPPPKPVPGLSGARRTTPAMAGLWETEPADAQNAGSDSQAETGRRVVRRVATVCAGLAVLAAASGAVLQFLPRAFVSNQIPAATFNAPMMVLRANGPGRVVAIAVQNGQTVEPDTLLLTIRTDPQPDPAAALLRARLEAAQARLSDLDQSLAQATPTTDAARTRMADLRRQRAAAVIDVAQLQDAVANIPAAKPTDLPVKAGVHGVIRSLEARTGTTTAAGVPLVRMLDCDHAFLTVAPDSKLHAGEAVQVRLPNLPPVAATVRQSVGIAEPPDSLVIATPPGAFIGELSGSCPIGATASVTPSMTGS